MTKDEFMQKLADRQPKHLERYNYDLLPEKFLAHDKIKISCLLHGSFEQKAHVNLLGSGCRLCAIGERAAVHRYTTEEFIVRAKKKCGDRFDYSKTVYEHEDTPLIVTCQTHGDISISAYQHFTVRFGCPQCSTELTRKHRLEDCIRRARRAHGDVYDYSRVVFVNMNEKVEIICPSHGSFWQSLYGHIAKKNECPNCSVDKARLTLDNFMARSKIVHNDNYSYDKVEFEGVGDAVTITCKRHGDFKQRVASHLGGSGCMKCYRDANRLSVGQFIENARKVHGGTYDYSKVDYQGNKIPVEIVCPNHGSFWQRPNTHVSSRNGCQLCWESKGEKAVEVFLKAHGINHIREYRMHPHRFRYDFFIPEFNIYIEFNGKQHYEPVELFGGLPAFLDLQRRDAVKKRLVEENGGSLIVLTHLNLTDSSVERELIWRLKRIYARWYVIDGQVRAFRTVMDVCHVLGTSMSTTLDKLDAEVCATIQGARVLFPK